MNIIKLMKARSAKKCRLRRLFLVAPVLVLTACGTDQGLIPKMNLSSLSWLNDGNGQTPVSVTMPAQIEDLAQGNKVEMRIFNAIQLARKKRFDDALDLMAAVRMQLDPDSEGFLAVTCSMALIALRAGDIREFKNNARVLDMALGQPISVPEPYVEVVSLYRAMVGKSMPVNTPEGIQRMKDQRALTAAVNLN